MYFKKLFYHLSKQRVFPEARVKFYAAEISHAIGYMHSLNVIYRDLKVKKFRDYFKDFFL
jgi:serine/threonine protein kinase